MAAKPETLLQQKIQKYLEAKGAYVNKNWGNMFTKPGIADLTVCYRGLYIAIEVKVGNNKPTEAQMVHANLVQNAGGISVIVWSLDEVKELIEGIENGKIKWYR